MKSLKKSNELIVLGNLMDPLNINYSNYRVYSGGGIAPTIGASGFGKDRFVMEKQVKRIGNLNNKSGGSFAGQVYDKSGLAPTLTDMQGGGRQPHIISKKSIRGGGK